MAMRVRVKMQTMRIGDNHIVQIICDNVVTMNDIFNILDEILEGAYELSILPDKYCVRTEPEGGDDEEQGEMSPDE